MRTSKTTHRLAGQDDLKFPEGAAGLPIARKRKTPADRRDSDPQAAVPQTPPPVRFVSARQVAARYGCSIATVWRWTRDDPCFPRPIRISASCTRWREADLLAFEASLGSQS